MFIKTIDFYCFHELIVVNFIWGIINDGTLFAGNKKDIRFDIFVTV